MERAMDDMTTVATAERDRLIKERSNIETKIDELQSQVADIDRKLAAIDAYQKALNGRLPTKALPGRRQGGKRAGRGEKQAQVFSLVEAAAEGATRGQLLEKLGVKGDKAGE